MMMFQLDNARSVYLGLGTGLTNGVVTAHGYHSNEPL